MNGHCFLRMKKQEKEHLLLGLCLRIYLTGCQRAGVPGCLYEKQSEWELYHEAAT